MKDTDIIDLYWLRNEEAIAQTAVKYGNYCHSISYNILHSQEDAQECVNDTYHSAWNAMPPQRPAYLSAFLGRITRNISLNRFKQYNTQKRGGGQVILALSELEDCIPAAATVEQAVEERFLVEAINTFLYAQPERKRNIFIRRYWYLDPIDQIAKAYGLTRSNTASILHRMRCELKVHLEKEGITL